MRVITKSFIMMISTLILVSCADQPSQKILESLFTERGIAGTIGISNLDGSKKYQAFPERARTPFLPASTFKIPNSLIALEEAAVSSPEEVLFWDGEVRFVDAWNQDHSMKTAFPVSCVWFYQDIALRIGNEKYLQYLKNFEYGNMITGPELTKFWLDGDIRITTEEQISFLKKFYKNDLPINQEHLAQVKEIMIFEETGEYTILAKTGWAIRTDGEHGWWVGYVIKKDEVWFFAINIEINSNEDYGKQKDITREALTLIGVLPQTQKDMN
ncbi:MAG: class D beta-lactamase [Candidatus Marinimicrobia bacterium]|jgi:beta-lactamase class D|nr:class D beta-lactamase [Candidatus Neomarinimicrobiota bacterium]MBT3576884.1 class D beta-lactamase [Candidatus Neomarinimicrobiota bacterium]MBT3680215.1 class D beta-lactamase [Candidatus Neomarinimicrobiota bacterium]MBT3951925.1 class D beta-lactamase [Candidatus Neomarinimicrobiota bacterium]MBT4251806.1 class D beta-lactamase [Candidatus Neomarinimicrobiota bacterium]